MGLVCFVVYHNYCTYRSLDEADISKESNPRDDYLPCFVGLLVFCNYMRHWFQYFLRSYFDTEA